MDTKTLRRKVFRRIGQELDRAYSKHGNAQWGRHEFYTILKEEVDELWDAIKSDEPQARVVEEALQVASMVFRYLETGDRYKW
jgi:NTP pyrophosphatase (non-canonical NTP hydrolase)